MHDKNIYMYKLKWPEDMFWNKDDAYELHYNNW